MAFLLLGSFQVSGQIIANLVIAPADNPNLPGNSPWSLACAGNNGGFNQYYITAAFDGASNSGNEWILELSDANGDFSVPVELAKLTSDAQVKDPGFEFSLPTDTRGADYLIRARSTDPAETSPSIGPFSMYYMDYVSSLIITHDGSQVPQSDIISTNPITLSVENLTDPSSYQFRWFKDLSVISGENGPSINVTESGMYFVQIDYGDCSDNGTTNSNVPNVCIGAVGGGTTINPPSTTTLCSGDTELLTVSTGLGSPTYQWIKDGVDIPGATASTYTVDASTVGFEGDYQVQVSESNNCPEISPAITFTNADDFTITRVNAASLVLLPSETGKTLNVTTTAASPTYQWYMGTTPVGTNSDTYIATQAGTYHVEVTQPAGTCPNPTTKTSESTEVVTPQSFEIVIDFVTPHQTCVDTSIALELATINAILADGSSIDVTSDVQSSFAFQWNLNGAPVGGATSSSISLTDTTENGDYSLDGSVDTFNPTSNSLTVQLLTSETVSITSTSTVYCNATDTITLSTTSDLTGESFEWQRDGTSINTTDASFDVNQPGTYRLVIDKNGCPLNSNEIAITPLDPDLITIDPAGTIVFPEGTTRTATASGGTAYRWLDSNSVELSNTSSVTFDTDGSYTLIANIDNCEISRQVTVEYLDTFNVPNVITPNGDGINDQWVLPNSYSNKPEINVIIYHASGEELISVNDYKNDWPDASMAFPKQNMIFYYAVKDANKVLKQGTITVIR